MIKPEWFKCYSPDDRPQRFEQVVQSWDTANTASETSDYSVCTTWGIRNRQIYLLNVLRARMEYAALSAAHDQKRRYQPTAILIEDKASGTQLIQELRHEGLKSLIRCMPESSKETRVSETIELIREGSVFVPAEAPWRQTYLRELSTFPGGVYKDQVDSTSQALGWITFPPPEPNALVYVRLEVARLKMSQGLSLEEAAGEAGLAPEQLDQMLQDIRQSREDVEQRELQRRRKRTCRRCHKPITTSRRWEQGDLCYHLECFDGCSPVAP